MFRSARILSWCSVASISVCRRCTGAVHRRSTYSAHLKTNAHWGLALYRPDWFYLVAVRSLYKALYVERPRQKQGSFFKTTPLHLETLYICLFHFRSFLRVQKSYFSLRKYFKRKIHINSFLNTQINSFFASNYIFHLLCLHRMNPCMVLNHHILLGMFFTNFI